VWQTDLSEAGWLDWSHARQIVRAKRTAIDPKTGEVSVGNRYYLSTKSVSELWSHKRTDDFEGTLGTGAA
jgi:hypothetical protein